MIILLRNYNLDSWENYISDSDKIIIISNYTVVYDKYHFTKVTFYVTFVKCIYKCINYSYLSLKINMEQLYQM